MPPTLPVAPSWFRVRPLPGGLTRIDEPYVDEGLRANVWHLRGSERDLLIDTGLGVGRLRPALPELFRREPLVVLTHGHLDHMGSAHEFAEVWAHPLEAIEEPPPGSLDGPALARELELELAPGEEMPELMISALPDAEYDPAGYRLRGTPVARWIEEGDAVELGDRLLEVLHFPGHSPGGIALLDRRDGTLFSGDIVYDDYLLDEIVGADRADYARSMERLRELEVSAVHGGHGESFDRQRLLEIVDEYLRERAEGD